MQTAIAAILMFLLLIIFHEGGHFIAAKRAGVKVNEFSIGMGPKLFSKTKGDTEYSIRVFPIGGYVAMEGEDADSSDPRSFSNAKVFDRIKIVASGALTNFLIAFILFLIVNFSVGIPTPEIKEVVQNSPAQVAGLQEGDVILSLNKKEIVEWDDIGEAIKENVEGDIVEIEIKRGQHKFVKSIEVLKEQGRSVIGIYSKTSHNILKAIAMSLSLIIEVIGLMFTFILNLFRGAVSKNDVGGPIVIINEVGKAAKLGWENLFYFLGFLNVNLGFINLLPLPALDGSRLVFLLIEAVRKKPIPVEKEGAIHFIGFILLMALMVYILFLDLGKIGVL